MVVAPFDTDEVAAVAVFLAMTVSIEVRPTVTSTL
jgi:hypothetical protein